MSSYLLKKLEEERSAALGVLTELQSLAETEKRSLTDEEGARLAEAGDKLHAIAERAKQLIALEKSNADADAAMREHLGEPEVRKNPNGEKPAARSLSEHFAMSGMAEQMRAYARGAAQGTSFASGEFRAASDPTLIANTGGVPTTYGDVYQTKYRRLTVADLCSAGTLSTNSLTYWTQGTLTGDVTSVAEGATKPSLNFVFGQVTETLTKLAGVTKVSQEMTEDAEFLVSVIQSQLGQRLMVVEEDQLLNGNGTAPNLRGLLSRVGIQTYATPATSTPKKTMDGIFHGQNMIRINSFIEPDGIVMNPTDYENVRLGVDGQAQYYGGGPFTGAYGNDGLQIQPGLWGLNTVVTPAIAAGTVLVGGFKTAAQVFRKGGIQLDSTNSNEDDFKKNLVALRIEERLALAVYYPTALVKITITA